jgi:microcin C transport system permease protein
MIEKLIKNDLTLKRYRRFKRNRTAVISVWVLLIFSFFSFTAELWSNNKPLIMSYQSQIYIPLFNKYHPTDFGRTDIFVMDYRAIEAQADWVIWPINRWNPFERNETVDTYPSAPSKDNWMGTDDRGRDVFARLLYGYRYSIIYAFGVWLLSYSLGALIGALMGYLGGKTDLVGSRFVEIIEMTPTLLLLITLISIFEPSMALLVIFSVMFDWTGIFHHMRSQFLQLRNRDYVDAARALGSSHWRIITKHIFPNALTPLVTFSPFAIAANISGLAILDYLGLGLRAPTPSWGELMSQAQKYFSLAEWLVWYPSLALLITMTALISIGQAVRDAYDSRSF